MYYVVVCAWSLFYLVSGFTSHLPWADCGNRDHNTVGCFSQREVARCQVKLGSELALSACLCMQETLQTAGNLTYYNSTCFTYQQFCHIFHLGNNKYCPYRSCAALLEILNL